MRVTVPSRSYTALVTTRRLFAVICGITLDIVGLAISFAVSCLPNHSSFSPVSECLFVSQGLA